MTKVNAKKQNGTDTSQEQRDTGKNPRRAPNSVVPIGDLFMPKVDLEILRKRAQKEKTPKTKFRLIACRMRKGGKGIRQIARTLNMSYSTVRDWLFRMHKGGLKRLFYKKRSGRKKILSDETIEKIKEWLNNDPLKYGYEAGFWQTNMIQNLLKKTFNIVCKLRTLSKTIKYAGFSYRKVRHTPSNSASLEKQEQFKEETNKKINELCKDGYVVFTQDETHISLYQTANYGWHRTNGHNTMHLSYAKKSVTVFGVLGKDDYHIKTVDTSNGETFIEFLKELLCMYPKIVMVLDNASYHKSKAVQEFVESTNGALELIFLPPYTPQLNSIEQQWNMLKRLLCGRYFSSPEELKHTIYELVRKHEMRPVKTFDYLLPKQ